MSQSKRKQYINSLEEKKYNVAEAMEFIQASPKVKFNESIDVAINPVSYTHLTLPTKA